MAVKTVAVWIHTTFTFMWVPKLRNIEDNNSADVLGKTISTEDFNKFIRYGYNEYME